MYKVGVIGLGHIAATYETPESPFPYCHVGGIRRSDRVELAAVADLSAAARDQFRTTWGPEFPELAYCETSQALLDTKPDIVAVCVRGPYHFDVMMEVIEAAPRAIFLEKPPSCSLEQMDRMAAAAGEKHIPITVSYSRHWSPHVLRLQELVRDGLIGEVKTVVGYTGSAVLSFASHTTDLLCQFAGYCPEAVFAVGSAVGEAPAGFEPEPSLDSMIVEFANGVWGIQINASGEHGGFYCDVFGTKGSVRAGIYIPPAARDEKNKPIELALHNMPPNRSVFAVAYDQIAAHLEGGPLPHCTNDDFVKVNEIGFAAIESIHTGQRITLPNVNRSRKVYANG